ncbi:hypothetical protein LINPERPRIM_LOCUS37331 [Linum perenne]
MKDLATQSEIYRGHSKDGLYSLPLHVVRRILPQACVASLQTGHHRLGQANFRSVKQGLSHHSIKI